MSPWPAGQSYARLHRGRHNSEPAQKPVRQQASSKKRLKIRAFSYSHPTVILNHQMTERRRQSAAGSCASFVPMLRFWLSVRLCLGGCRILSLFENAIDPDRVRVEHDDIDCDEKPCGIAKHRERRNRVGSGGGIRGETAAGDAEIMEQRVGERDHEHDHHAADHQRCRARLCAGREHHAGAELHIGQHDRERVDEHERQELICRDIDRKRLGHHQLVNACRNKHPREIPPRQKRDITVRGMFLEFFKTRDLFCHAALFPKAIRREPRPSMPDYFLSASAPPSTMNTWDTPLPASSRPSS